MATINILSVILGFSLIAGLSIYAGINLKQTWIKYVLFCYGGIQSFVIYGLLWFNEAGASITPILEMNFYLTAILGLFMLWVAFFGHTLDTMDFDKKWGGNDKW